MKYFMDTNILRTYYIENISLRLSHREVVHLRILYFT